MVLAIYQSEIPLSCDGIIYFCQSRRTSERYISGKQRICLGRHISTFRGYRIFINYQKPLYKSLHQSFFYSFITILPSESGVTLHYSHGNQHRTDGPRPINFLAVRQFSLSHRTDCPVNCCQPLPLRIDKSRFSVNST